MDKLKLIETILESKAGFSGIESPFQVGEKVFIRTVTYHLTGKIKAHVGKFLVLEDAAWIADSGRFMAAINDGTLNEVEPVKCDVRVNIDTIVDVYEWAHALPRTQK